MQNKFKAVKVVSKVQVTNALGLHIRPAVEIVKILQNFKAQVFLTYKKETVNARSVLGIIMLAAKNKAKITITIEGEDAEATSFSLIHAFEIGFGE